MSENEILKRIQNDDQRDLGLIYEKYRAEFLNWTVKRFHCSLEDSKDIYQITILIFYDNVKNGKLKSLASSIKTYLFAIGKNVAREHLRKSGGNTRSYDVHLFRQYPQQEEDDQVDESFFEAASNAVARLTEPGRQLIELYYYDKKTMGEISELLRYKNADTVKNQKCKIMVRLRKLFHDEIKKGRFASRQILRV